MERDWDALTADAAILAAQTLQGPLVRFYFNEGEITVDGRVINDGAVNFDRSPPLPIMLQTQNPESGGHAGAELAGVITALYRDGNTVVAYGQLDIGSDAGQEAQRLIEAGVLATWSPDLGNADYEIQVLSEDENGMPDDWLERYSTGTLIGVTLVPLPATDSAMVAIIDQMGNAVSTPPVRAGQPAPPEDAPTQTVLAPASPMLSVDLHAHTDPPSHIADHLMARHDMTQADLPDGTAAMHAAHAQMHGGDIGAQYGVGSTNLTVVSANTPATTTSTTQMFFTNAEPFASDAPWDGSAGRFTDAQYQNAAAACDPARTGTVKERCFLPHHEPAGALNTAGVHAAAQRVSSLKGRTPEAIASAKAHLRSHYTKDLKEPVPDSLQASALAACAGPDSPPEEWFTDPHLDELQRFVTVTDDGHVFGHIAGWGECHIGRMNACVQPPEEDEFPYFRVGQVRTDTGALMATGVITLRGGHATLAEDPKSAQAHYDDTASGVCDVACGSDEFGIWFSGALRPNVTEEEVRVLRASGVSGDWRQIGGKLRLIAVCSVNTPGFPKVRARLSASGEMLALFAAGGAPEPAPGTCGCRSDKLSVRLTKRLNRVETILRASGVEQSVLDSLAARLS